ncbi:MAG: peptide-methionine (S)-S-oxide reductase MsrA [Bacteroidales bacterium]|nr:peptide-methionine (S)-S-oxide reductase MsrA [Bacteroidales bacterium]
MNNQQDTATFGSGCFWCSEAIFSRLEGVSEVVSGYSGGKIPDPTYELVTQGESGYAEVVQLLFDPAVISYRELLGVFWQTHDPTTLNRQGADTGTQYRSVIFYHNEEQYQTAKHYMAELEKAKIWGKPVVTELSPFDKFYPAADEHQNFYENNPAQGYCNFVITPKIKKFERVFSEKLKK